ncbi:MAG: HlyD family efflux transporter periplasmic adaptor subunit [Rhodobacteraceae bacterium]|nr:HlyD family efflux transporter periplasmic adaptor subunit [Paracoccaceae bacterium]
MKRVIAILDLPPRRAVPTVRESVEAAAERWNVELHLIRRPLQPCHPFWQKMFVCGDAAKAVRPSHVLQIDNDRQQEITKELREVRAKLFEATERLGMLEDQSRRLDITAPVDGTVINLAYVTVGGVVPPGATILAIVPSNEKIVAQAQVSPADIDSVHPGQSVSIRFSTVAAKNIPVLEGTLEYVSADRLTMEQRPGTATAAMPTLVPNAFYTARVTIDPKEMEKLGDVKLHTGMPVEVLTQPRRAHDPSVHDRADLQQLRARLQGALKQFPGA